MAELVLNNNHSLKNIPDQFGKPNEIFVSHMIMDGMFVAVKIPCSFHLSW